MRVRALLAGLWLSIHAAVGFAADARAYPERPIRLVVPFPPGGGVDIVSRILAREMSDKLGQQVVVDNRAGASGAIGSETVARATPDGYTLLMGNVASHAVNVSMQKTLPYDPLKDFAPITRVADVPEILLVHPAVPANSVKELIALARSKPGQLTFGSAGNGTPPHLAAELFKSLAGIDIRHIPYKGTPPALADLMGGQISMVFSNIVSGLPLARGGKVRALGVTSDRRSGVAPEFPSIAEAGLPGYKEYSWYGVLGPARTPATVVTRLNEVVVQILKSPAMVERLTQQGADVVTSTPREFHDFMKSEIEKFAKIVKASGLRPE